MFQYIVSNILINITTCTTNITNKITCTININEGSLKDLKTMRNTSTNLARLNSFFLISILALKQVLRRDGEGV